MFRFWEYDAKGCPYTEPKLYGAAMFQYGDDDKLLVQTFPKSLIGAALSWFTKVEILKIEQLVDLDWSFIEQCKSNIIEKSSKQWARNVA